VVNRGLLGFVDALTIDTSTREDIVTVSAIKG